MNGWIKLHRQIVESNLWELEPFTKAQAWIDLLMITNHKESYITLRNGEIVKLQRGECGYSKISLAKRWKWSRNKVSRFIDFLINEKMIQQKDISKTTVLVILNFDKFQSDTTNETSNDTSNETSNDTSNETSNDTSNETLTRMIKNDKNVKNDKKQNIDVCVFDEVEKIFQIYEENCPNLCKIRFERRLKPIRDLIGDYLNTTDGNISLFKDICIKANELKEIAGNRIDLKSILNNYAGILSDKYKKTNTSNSNSLTKEKIMELMKQNE